MAKGKKTGGRQKGSQNKTTKEIQGLVDAIFRKVNPAAKAIKLLEFGTDRTQATVLLRLLEYRYGKPKEKIDLEVSGPEGGAIEHTIRFGGGSKQDEH